MAAPLDMWACAHGADACCTRCASATDGVGFQHPSEAGGRKRLQQCRHCSGWIEPQDWVNDIKGAWFGCRSCAERMAPTETGRARKRRSAKPKDELVPFDSEHSDWPAWGSPDWAPMMAPTRLTWLLEGGLRRDAAE